MTLAAIAIVLSGIGILVTGYLAFIFLRDPVAGMREVSHHGEQLPHVMTDRYIAFTALAAGATWYGDMAVIAFLFAVFAFMSFADAAIYMRAGKPVGKHFAAGAASVLVTSVAVAALVTGGVDH